MFIFISKNRFQVSRNSKVVELAVLVLVHLQGGWRSSARISLLSEKERNRERQSNGLPVRMRKGVHQLRTCLQFQCKTLIFPFSPRLPRLLNKLATEDVVAIGLNRHRTRVFFLLSRNIMTSIVYILIEGCALAPWRVPRNRHWWDLTIERNEELHLCQSIRALFLSVSATIFCENFVINVGDMHGGLARQRK